MKKTLLALIAIAALSCSSTMFARRGDFFGGFAGGATGAMIGSAINQPREKTVIIREQAQPQVDNSMINQLQQDLDRMKYKIEDLEKDNNALKEEIKEVEKDNDELKEENREQRRIILDLQRTKSAPAV